MKLVFLTKRTTVHGFGGVETHVWSLTQMAVELGHEVVLLTTAHPDGVEEEERDGCRVVYLAGVPPGRWWKQSAEVVRRLLRQGFGDLILSYNLAGYGVAASKVGIPHYAFSSGRTLDQLVSEWHNWSGLAGLAAYPKHALALCYYAWFERRLWARLDGIIATYDALYESLLRQGRRTILCYNGTDPRIFRPDKTLRESTRKVLDIPPEATVLLMVATVNRQKGIWVGVEAFRSLAPIQPDLHLIIVGDGPDRPRLEASLRGSLLASRVHFVGAVPHQATAPYFATADLFLFPTFRAEGLPNAIVEAMATGLPVVASDRGGIRSAVQHGETGLLLSLGCRVLDPVRKPAHQGLVALVHRALSAGDCRPPPAQGYQPGGHEPVTLAGVLFLVPLGFLAQLRQVVGRLLVPDVRDSHVRRET